MKYTVLIGLLAIILVSANVTYGQFDPYGSVDSVIIEDKIVTTGSAFSLKITLKNDEPISAVSLPLTYPTSLIVCDSASFVNSRIRQWSVLRFNNDSKNGKILFGGLAVGDPLLLSGSGVIAELYFHTAANVQAGDAGAIDTAFFPPAGAYVITSYQSVSIQPAFHSGSIVIGLPNHPPEFAPQSPKTINEGEDFSLVISAIDQEASEITLYAGKLPAGSRFTDNGDGTGVFSWSVPYVGTGSSTGSPYAATFFASDGKETAEMTLPIEVVNTNRPPRIVTNTAVTAFSGDSVYIPITASDPDFESVTLTASDLPTGARIHSSNPGYIDWQSTIADSGRYFFTVNAVDESGGVTSQPVTVRLLPIDLINLSIGEEQAFTNEFVSVPIVMSNRVEVSGFKLSIRYDPTAISLMSSKRDTLRTRNWQTFTTTTSTDGWIFIDAHSSPGTPGGGPLAPDSGAIAVLNFFTSSDPAFAGMHTPIEFAFVDSLDSTENTVSLPTGSIVSRTQVNYSSGGVMVKKYDGLVGDINLNSIPFEIADAVYFTNYFINPYQYPLSGERWVNSDINQDGHPGTLADLVTLLRIINGSSSGKIGAGGLLSALNYTIDSSDQELGYHASSFSEIAAATYMFKIPQGVEVKFAASQSLDGMEVKTNQIDDQFRILIFSSKGRTLKIDGTELFRLSGSAGIELVLHEYVDASGNEISITETAKESQVPAHYDLSQNYPNPFNPETVISFDLPSPGKVTLTVFNMLGEEVKRIVDKHLPAGRHQAGFNGKDDTGKTLPSGVYFYSLKSEDFTATRKMLLLK